MKTAAAALGTLERKSYGPGNSDSDQDQEALETEKKLTHELFSTASKQYNEAVAATHELLQNLLAGKPQTQWDHIVREMPERDSRAGANGKKPEGKRPKGFTLFLGCQELQKRTVIPA